MKSVLLNWLLCEVFSHKSFDRRWLPSTKHRSLSNICSRLKFTGTYTSGFPPMIGEFDQATLLLGNILQNRNQQFCKFNLWWVYSQVSNPCGWQNASEGTYIRWLIVWKLWSLPPMEVFSFFRARLPMSLYRRVPETNKCCSKISSHHTVPRYLHFWWLSLFRFHFWVIHRIFMGLSWYWQLKWFLQQLVAQSWCPLLWKLTRTILCQSYRWCWWWKAQQTCNKKFLAWPLPLWFSAFCSYPSFKSFSEFNFIMKIIISYSFKNISKKSWQTSNLTV